jgi:hypothetical protein
MASKEEALSDAAAEHITGYQFSNIWISVDGEDTFSLATDDGTSVELSTDEVAQLVDRFTDLLTAHEEIFKGVASAD